MSYANHICQYFVHGRLIETRFVISELLPHAFKSVDSQSLRTEVVFTITQCKRTKLPTPARAQWLARSPGGTSIAALGSQFFIESYCGTCALIDADTKHIFVSRPPRISTSRFNHTIMHSLLPYGLTMQGDIVLHAACVKVGGKTILMCGEGGRGKSTLAAGFQQRGATLLGEDIVRVEVQNNRLIAFPSYAGARLRSDSFLLHGRRRLRAGSAFGLPKHRNSFAPLNTQIPTASPIDSVLFLAAGPRIAAQFSEVSKAVFLRELLSNGFVATADASSFRSRWFLELSGVVGAMDGAFVRYRKSPAHFQSLLDAIAEHSGTNLAPLCTP
jgi:hypothetical protein